MDDFKFPLPRNIRLGLQVFFANRPGDVICWWHRRDRSDVFGPYLLLRHWEHQDAVSLPGSLWRPIGNWFLATIGVNYRLLQMHMGAGGELGHFLLSQYASDKFFIGEIEIPPLALKFPESS